MQTPHFHPYRSADGVRVGVAFLIFAFLQFFLSENAVSAFVGSSALGQFLHLAQVAVMFGASLAVIAARGIAHPRLFQRVAIGVAWVFTLIFMLKLGELMLALDRTRQPEAARLLLDAALLWVNNVLIFAIWYWLFDAGGPEGRLPPADDRPVDLLFPQEASQVPGYAGWTPNYFDYVYVAFCVSTTLGPSDTIALSRRTKVLVMLQALASIVILSVIAARAIGIIG